MQKQLNMVLHIYILLLQYESFLIIYKNYLLSSIMIYIEVSYLIKCPL